jgi:hypothetical protein
MKLIVLLTAGLAVLEPLVLGGQDTIQLFAKLQKLLPILLHRDARAKFMNPFALGSIHAERSITIAAIFGMFDVERW